MATFNDLDRVLFADQVFGELEGSTPAYSVADTSTTDELQFVGQSIRIPVLADSMVAQDTASATYQTLSADGILMTVDFDKTVAFKVGDRDIIKTGQDWVSKGAKEAGRILRKAWDASILSKVSGASTVLDNGGAGYAPANVTDMLDDVAAQMDALDLPDEGRYIIVPALVKGAIRAALSDRSTSWGDSVAKDGFVEMARGVKVYLSNNTAAASVSSYNCMAGVEGYGIAAVVQINPEDVEILRDPDANAFGYRVKARALGGSKVYLADKVISVLANTV